MKIREGEDEGSASVAPEMATEQMQNLIDRNIMLHGHRWQGALLLNNNWYEMSWMPLENTSCCWIFGLKNSCTSCLHCPISFTWWRPRRSRSRCRCSCRSPCRARGPACRPRCPPRRRPSPPRAQTERRNPGSPTCQTMNDVG